MSLSNMLLMIELIKKNTLKISTQKKKVIKGINTVTFLERFI